MPKETSTTSRVVIVTGCPGAGKTTACARLANADPLGVHIRGDDFLDYIAHLISPIDPASHEQNAVALAAAAQAARTYADGGYQVYLDGIFGPWFMDHILAQLREGARVRHPIHYVILNAPIELALARATGRSMNPASAPAVRKMHLDFSAAADYRGHILAVADLDEAAVYETLASALATDRFLVR